MQRVDYQVDLSLGEDEEEEGGKSATTTAISPKPANYVDSNNNHSENQFLILSETFFLNSKLKKKVKINLYKKFIEIIKNGKEKNDETNEFEKVNILYMRDIAGSTISKDKKDKNSAYLTIYAYPKNKEINYQVLDKLKEQKNFARKRCTVELGFNKFSTYDENFSLVNQWHKRLEAILKNKETSLDWVLEDKQILNEKQIENSSLKKQSEISLEKPFLVLVNPHAGAAKAKKIYFNRIVPVWNESNTPDTVVFTTHQNFAREYVKKLKVEDYRGIVVVSGDGLVFEVINGLMDRDDWREAIKTPIGQIPGGSANALACCVSYLTDECFRNLSLENFATSMTFNLVKSQPQPIDLISIELSNSQVVHSFLAVEWAIVADVDLESEKYRYLGGLRFIVGALKRILNLRIYRGRVSFLPSDDMKDYKPKDPTIKLLRNQGNSSLKDSRFTHLVPFGEDLPNDWITMEENFVLFLIVNLPLIAPDFIAVPHSKFEDESMHLIFIKEGISKLEMIQLFQDAENGAHFNSPFVEHVKIKAFRLEPIGLKLNNEQYKKEDGIIMVDGELVPYGQIQGEVIPKLANVLAFNKSSD